MKTHIKAPALALTAAFALSGCNLLDVNNPNELVEESVQLESAANAVVNGSLRLVSEAVGSVWEAPGVVADEFYWTGSRDAWGQLDNGFIADPYNEFTDAAFPNLGRAVWMAQEAVDVLTEHVANNPGVESFELDLARAQFFNGIALMVTGEIQDDMTFSDKMEDGPAMGPANMFQVLDDAITNLDAAVTGFAALGEDDLETAARAVRARALMSRAIWDAINPAAPAAGSTPVALDFGAAVADANAVLAEVGGSDWTYDLAFTSESTGSAMLSNVNERGENQINDDLVANTGPGATERGAVVLNDPVSGTPDAAVAKWETQFGDDDFGALTLVSERLLRLIVAEDALNAADAATFETQIDAIRDLDSKAEFTSGGAVSDMAMLMHERRVNTLFMGLRLQDMYRWGLTDPRWLAGSQALAAPGTMLPITIIECRANQYLDNNTCAPTT